MNQPRIMIVDDDPALLGALGETLRLRLPGATVVRCDSAPEAIHRLAEGDLDLVVSDIKMPGMDGLALLAEIRALRPETPVLLITGHGQHDLAVQALRGGAFDFIQKPIDRDYFLASLHRALRVRELSRKVEAQRTALQRHAQELEQIVETRTRELRDANQMKDTFLAMLAHEMRNPLAPILNSVELLRLHEVTDPKLRNAHEIIDRQVTHMARLLDDLLDISRIHRGKIALAKEPVELGPVIRAAVETCQPLIDARNHQLRVTLPDRPVILYADPTRLEQIVANLLNNAAKYTEPGGQIWLTAAVEDDQVTGWQGDKVTSEAEPPAAVGTEPVSPGHLVTPPPCHHVIISVRDTGVGIDPAVLPRIFDLCFQADSSLHRAEGGLGLGLTLVRHMVELHAGMVSASSPGPGKGSEFIVRLPSAAIETRSTESPGPAPSTEDKPTRRGPRPAARPARTRRVLIIEDLPDSRETMADLLTLWGHQVETAIDGPEGIAKALVNRPEIALIDIGLPGLDGFEVAKQLRRELGSSVRLVALTGYGQPDDRRRAKEAGFDYHLVKPANLEQLARVLGEE